MKTNVKQEIKRLILDMELNCSVREFKNKVDWYYISEYQKLSDGFIREFQDKVDWVYISTYQRLSEGFIREFQNKVNWEYISRYQKLSPEFVKEFNLEIDPDNWLYKTVDEKRELVKACGMYEFEGEDHIIAYKGIRSDRYSKFNFQYYYEKGCVYESHCDCTDDESSFGLSAWTREKAETYCNELVVRVRIHIADIGRLVHDNGKIRCFKQEILD